MTTTTNISAELRAWFESVGCTLTEGDLNAVTVHRPGGSSDLPVGGVWGPAVEGDWFARDWSTEVMPAKGVRRPTRDQALTYILDNQILIRVAAEMRLPHKILHLLVEHEYDSLVFGGTICTKCTPEDCDDPDDNVWYPCPTLREAGMTEPIAEAFIKAHQDQRDVGHRAVAKVRMAAGQ